MGGSSQNSSNMSNNYKNNNSMKSFTARATNKNPYSDHVIVQNDIKTDKLTAQKAKTSKSSTNQQHQKQITDKNNDCIMSLNELKQEATV